MANRFGTKSFNIETIQYSKTEINLKVTSLKTFYFAIKKIATHENFITIYFWAQKEIYNHRFKRLFSKTYLEFLKTELCVNYYKIYKHFQKLESEAHYKFKGTKNKKIEDSRVKKANVLFGKNSKSKNFRTVENCSNSGTGGNSKHLTTKHSIWTVKKM